VKSCPTKFNDRSASFQGLDVTEDIPPVGRVAGPPVPDRQVDRFPPQRRSPLEGDAFPLELLKWEIPPTLEIPAFENRVLF